MGSIIDGFVSGRIQLTPAGDCSACHVSNGEQIVPAAPGGEFRLPWVNGRHRFLFVIPPDGYRAVGRWYFDDNAIRNSSSIEFQLHQQPVKAGSDFSILHVTDFHVLEGKESAHGESEVGPKGFITDYPNESTLREALLEYLAATPQVDFVIATGDLTDAGDEESLAAVARVLNSLPVPVYTIFGGHDGNVERGAAAGAPGFYAANWARHLSPPYYSWHWRGRHFLSYVSESASYLDPISRELNEAFAAEDLRLFGDRYPVTVCSHKHPYPWNEKVFHEHRVDSWLHGHFHCSRVMDERKIRVFSTGTPAFGMLDSNIAPAREIRFSAGRTPVGPIVAPMRPIAPAETRHEPILHHAWSLPGKNLSRLAQPCVTPHGICCGFVDDSAGTDGGVICIDPASRETRWTTPLAGSVESPVVATGDRLIAATQIGSVACLDAKTGSILWRHNLPETYDRWVYSRPLVSGDKVYIGTTSCLACLRLSDGAPLWQFRHPKKSSDAFAQFQGPLVRDGKLFLAGYRTGSFLFDAATGAVLHANEDAAVRYTSRVASNGSGYIIGSGIGELKCFDIATGKLRWEQRVAHNMVTSAFIPFAGALVGGTPDGLVCCSAYDGTILSRRSFGPDVQRYVAYRNHVRSCPASPLADEEYLYAPSGDGYLNVLRGTQLDLVDRLRLESPITSGLSRTSDGILLGVSVDGTLNGYKAILS